MTIAEALELTALVARKQPQRYGRFAARWLCLYLEEHEKATLEDVELLVLEPTSSREPEGPRLGARDSEDGRTAGLTSSLRRPTCKRRGEVHLHRTMRKPA